MLVLPFSSKHEHIVWHDSYEGVVCYLNLQGCALRKFLGSPSGSQPCQLGCPALKVGRPAPPPPPKKKRKKKEFSSAPAEGRSSGMKAFPSSSSLRPMWLLHSRLRINVCCFSYFLSSVHTNSVNARSDSPYFIWRLKRLYSAERSSAISQLSSQFSHV